MQHATTPRRRATLNSSVRFRTLTTLAEIDEISEAWQGLEASCTDHLTYFQSFSWCRNWVAVYATDGSDVQVRIETVWDDDELIAVWPLMTTSAGAIRIMRHLGDPHSQYGNLLCREDRLGGRDLEQLVARISDDPECDVAVFTAVPETSPLARLLPRGSRLPGCGDISSVLDLSGFANSDEYVQGLGRLRRRSRNRRRKQLERLGPLDFRVVWPDDPDFADLVRRCVAMKKEWLDEKGQYGSGFRVDGYDDFLARLTGDAATMSGACLSVLRAGDAVVAIELGFIRDRHYYSYVGAFDWDLRALSPGKVLMHMIVCWLIDNGVAAYDLLGNQSDYKQSWSNRVVNLSLHTLPFSWRGRVYAATWLPLLKPAVKSAYNLVPETLRKLIVPAQNFGLLLLYV